MRQDERDGLRLLGLDEFGQLRGIGLLQAVEADQGVLQRDVQPVQQFLGRVATECLDEQPFRRIRLRRALAGLRDGQAMEIVQYRVGDLRVDLPQA